MSACRRAITPSSSSRSARFPRFTPIEIENSNGMPESSGGGSARAIASGGCARPAK